MLKELNLLVFISLKDFHGHFLLDKRKTRNMNDCIHIISTGKVVIRKSKWLEAGVKYLVPVLVDLKCHELFCPIF